MKLERIQQAKKKKLLQEKVRLEEEALKVAKRMKTKKEKKIEKKERKINKLTNDLLVLRKEKEALAEAVQKGEECISASIREMGAIPHAE